MAKKPPIVGAGGVVYRQSRRGRLKVLLIKTRDGWALPKGSVKAGEAPDTTAIREIREETGITGTIEQHIGEVAYRIRRRTARREKRTTFYLLRYQGGSRSAQPDEGILHVRWTDPRKALRRVRALQQPILGRALALLYSTQETSSEQSAAPTPLD